MLVVLAVIPACNTAFCVQASMYASCLVDLLASGEDSELDALFDYPSRFTRDYAIQLAQTMATKAAGNTASFAAAAGILRQQFPRGEICLENDKFSRKVEDWEQPTELQRNVAAWSCERPNVNESEFISVLDRFRNSLYQYDMRSRGMTVLWSGELVYQYPINLVAQSFVARPHVLGCDVFALVLDACYSNNDTEKVFTPVQTRVGLYTRQQQLPQEAATSSKQTPLSDFFDVLFNETLRFALHISVIGKQVYSPTPYLSFEPDLQREWVQKLPYRWQKQQNCGKISKTALSSEITRIMEQRRKSRGNALIIFVSQSNDALNLEFSSVFAGKPQEYWNSRGLGFGYISLAPRGAAGPPQPPRFPEYVGYAWVPPDVSIAQRKALANVALSSWAPRTMSTRFDDQYSDALGHLIAPLCGILNDVSVICEHFRVTSILRAHIAMRHDMLLIDSHDFAVRLSLNESIINRHLGFDIFEDLEFRELSAAQLKRRCIIEHGSVLYIFTAIDGLHDQMMLMRVDLDQQRYVPATVTAKKISNAVICEEFGKSLQQCDIRVSVFWSNLTSSQVRFNQSFFDNFFLFTQQEFLELYQLSTGMYNIFHVALSQISYDSLSSFYERLSEFLGGRERKLLRVGRIFGFFDTFVGSANYSSEIYTDLGNFDVRAQNYAFFARFSQCQLLDQDVQSDILCYYLLQTKKKPNASQFTHTNYIVFPKNVFFDRLNQNYAFNWAAQPYDIVFQLDSGPIDFIILFQKDFALNLTNFIHFRLFDMGIITCSIVNNQFQFQLSRRMQEILELDEDYAFVSSENDYEIYHMARTNFVVFATNYVPQLDSQREVCEPGVIESRSLPFYAEYSNNERLDFKTRITNQPTANAMNIVVCAFLIVFFVFFVVVLAVQAY